MALVCVLLMIVIAREQLTLLFLLFPSFAFLQRAGGLADGAE